MVGVGVRIPDGRFLYLGALNNVQAQRYLFSEAPDDLECVARYDLLRTDVFFALYTRFDRTSRRDLFRICLTLDSECKITNLGGESGCVSRVIWVCEERSLGFVRSGIWVIQKRNLSLPDDTVDGIPRT